jgi:hypothetical protein
VLLKGAENLGHEFHYQNKKKTFISVYVRKLYFVSYSWKSTFIISAQNVLHEIQCTPRHVTSLTAASVQRCRGSCRWYDRHPQCDGEVPLRCQQELHTQGFSGVPTGKTLEDSNLVSVEAMQWVLLYLSIGHDTCYWAHSSRSTAEVCRSTNTHVPHSCSDCEWYICNW